MGIKIAGKKPAQVINTPARETLSDPPVRYATEQEIAAGKRLDTPVESAPAPRPLPKTSPSARVGDIVFFRSQEKAKQFNGTKDHVAVITRNWGKCVNLKVLPDCGDPYDATSQARIAYQDETGQGWFTIGEAQG